MCSFCALGMVASADANDYASVGAIYRIYASLAIAGGASKFGLLKACARGDMSMKWRLYHCVECGC